MESFVPIKGKNASGVSEEDFEAVSERVSPVISLGSDSRTLKRRVLILSATM